MEVTRQYWTVVAAGTFLAVWGVLVADPVPLLGTAAIGAWLLVRQYRFVRAVTRTRADLTVNLSTPRRVTAMETTQLTLEARVESAATVPVDIEATPPVAASGEPVVASLEPGAGRGRAHTTLTWPVAGAFTIDAITATFTDTDGLFCQTVDLATGVSVQVNPRTTHDIHVGEGGEPIATGFGDHEHGRLGTGIEPAEVRKYVPGDAVRQIDWKATARLDEPHVKEVEGGTERTTLLVLDHRAAMAEGRSGAQKLDYARQLALALVDQANELGDELGYYAVGDAGLTARVSPAARIDSWVQIRRQLLAVTPTNATETPMDPLSSAAVHTASTRLADDDTAFGQTLAPFFDARRTYQRQFDSLPLYQTVTNADFSSSTVVRTVIITDDTNRTELQETVKDARRKGNHVTVFLTPEVLFETTDLTELGRAYEEYVEFEEFRRELATLGRVDAFEVGPGDQLSAVLSAGRDRRVRGNT